MRRNREENKRQTESVFPPGRVFLRVLGILDLRRRQRMSDAGWGTSYGVGWNGDGKHCEMAELMWRAEMAFRRRKIGVLHETADERKLHEKIPGNNR